MTDQELIDYSIEHLLHELNMFWQVAEAIPLNEPNIPSFTMSLLLECFATHLRNLIEFFYFKPNGDYVRTSEFFENPGKWNPTLPAEIKQTLQRANEEVNHLTRGRKLGTPPDKVWDTTDLLKRIETVAKDFAASASHKKLSAKVRNFLLLPRGDMLPWLDQNATYSNVATASTTFNSASVTTVLPGGSPPRTIIKVKMR
jgi:hypothetical protein